MYKLIACDLDETLLNSDKEISERNVLAIKRAQQEFGIRFVPATGRGYTCIQNVLDTLDVHNKEDEYIISGNGSIICENKDFKKLTFHTLPFEKAKQLFTYGIEHGLCIQLFTDKDVYAYQINEDEKEWLFMFKSDAVVMEENTIDFLENTPIMKILFQRADMEYLRNIAQDMMPITDGVSISFSSDRYLEMNRAGVDKGLGLREL
ncbi:MAG: HAD-IIB family hydrolase, partial [Longicatena sp.]